VSGFPEKGSKLPIKAPEPINTPLIRNMIANRRIGEKPASIPTSFITALSSEIGSSIT
jgi:hypothetical protein